MQISLREYAEQVGQSKAAAALGMRQSAISKALKLGRKVVVTIDGDGRVFAEEMKPFPTQKREQHERA
ncbi:Cro/CI family transcriptional regulator [Cronobacter dublinensis]